MQAAAWPDRVGERRCGRRGLHRRPDRPLGGRGVIGLTGSAEKCRWLTETLGYDAAIKYKDGHLCERLKEAAPDRLDVIFDNVGGPILDESLKLIAMRGVVLLCGSTSQYAAGAMAGPNNYIWLGTMRARMQGFVVFDYADRYGEARARMARWIASGDLKLAEHVVDGDVADFPRAFQQLYEGQNLGKMLVKRGSIWPMGILPQPDGPRLRAPGRCRTIGPSR